MLKTSQKALRTVKSRFEKVEIGKKFLPEKNELASPEDRFFEVALEDVKYRGLITLALGKALSERIALTKTEVERFTMLYGMDPTNVKTTTSLGIIPLKRKGFEWASPQSKSLRRRYKQSASKMFDKLDLCNFDGSHVSSGVIELVDVPYKTSDFLEFSSAAGIVDKKPHKRRDHNSGDAVCFREFYSSGKRGMLFAVFDALSDKKKTDHKAASFLVSLFKKFFARITIVSEDQIFSMFEAFLNYAETQVTEHQMKLIGSSISMGIVFEGVMYYLNIGDSRIYTISYSPELRVRKVTIDDGMAGLVERGAKISKKEFFAQLKAPEYYIGGFSQQLNNRGTAKSSRRLYRRIKPVHPNIGKISLRDCDFVVVATDGFWSNLPVRVSGGKVVDASGVEMIANLLENKDSRDPRHIIESLYDYSRSNMKRKRSESFDGFLVKPQVQDIGILGFNV